MLCRWLEALQACSDNGTGDIKNQTGLIRYASSGIAESARLCVHRRTAARLVTGAGNAIAISEPVFQLSVHFSV